MRILLCNDDGIGAPGIVALAEKLSEIGTVYVAAPDQERSAASNSLSLSKPLRVRKVDFPVAVESAWSISGTPADCAKIALTTLMTEKPDLVVSGINRGPNLAVDVFYSGTVAAAFEGAFKGILSFAVSLEDFSAEASYDVAADWATRCIKTIVESDAPTGRVYNINVPGAQADKIKGIKITKSGKVDYRETFAHRLDPYGRSYYWMHGLPHIVDNNEDFDIVAVKNGYVSITPLIPDLTDHASYENLQKIQFEKV